MNCVGFYLTFRVYRVYSVLDLCGGALLKVLDNNNHSVFKLNYHMVLVTKYRKRVITDKVSDRLRALFIAISKPYNIILDEWNFEPDHVHILLTAHPNSCISKFINAYKSASSRLIKKEFSSVRKQLWKEMFWSRSFCILTVGGAPLEILKTYIASQGGSHTE